MLGKLTSPAACPSCGIRCVAGIFKVERFNYREWVKIEVETASGTVAFWEPATETDYVAACAACGFALIDKRTMRPKVWVCKTHGKVGVDQDRKCVKCGKPATSHGGDFPKKYSSVKLVHDPEASA